MKTFFDDIDSLQRFTQQLNGPLVPLTCPHCQRSGHFISHGFIYKKSHQSEPIIVGKRILCSNRYGHKGCGRTQQLYLKQRIPKLCYGAHDVWLFLLSLIAGMTIAQAYTKATQAFDSRNAYRWLAACFQNLTTYRTHLLRRQGRDNSITLTASIDRPRKTFRLSLVVTTLKALLTGPTAHCAQFQQATQQAFFL